MTIKASTILAIAITFAVSQYANGQASSETLRRIESACAAGGGIASAVVDDLRFGRLSEADQTAQYRLGSSISGAERNCMQAVRAAIPVLRAEGEKTAADRRMLEAQRSAEQAEARRSMSDSLQIGSTTCVAEPSTTASANSSFRNMVTAYSKGNMADARVSANQVLFHERQVATRSQVDCAEKVVASIRAEEDQVASVPSNQLKSLYISYIAMQACYENRKEFRVQYVTEQEMGAARTITRRDEQSLLQKFPQLAKQKDVVWEQAKQEHSRSNIVGLMSMTGTVHNPQVGLQCRVAAMRYTSDQGHQQQRIKKDF